jgi:hypothetical protein
MATVTNPTMEYIEKLDKLESEFLKLKKENIGKSLSVPISLKGVWKGIKVSEKDIAEAKKSLFRGMK